MIIRLVLERNKDGFNFTSKIIRLVLERNKEEFNFTSMIIRLVLEIGTRMDSTLPL